MIDSAGIAALISNAAAAAVCEKRAALSSDAAAEYRTMAREDPDLDAALAADPNLAPTQAYALALADHCADAAETASAAADAAALAAYHRSQLCKDALTETTLLAHASDSETRAAWALADRAQRSVDAAARYSKAAADASGTLAALLKTHRAARALPTIRKEEAAHRWHCRRHGAAARALPAIREEEEAPAQ